MTSALVTSLPKRPGTERLQNSLKPHKRLHCKTKLAGARSAAAPGRVSVLPGMRDEITVAAASLCEQPGNREQEQGCCSRAQRTDLSPRQQLCRRALPPRISTPEEGSQNQKLPRAQLIVSVFGHAWCESYPWMHVCVKSSWLAHHGPFPCTSHTACTLPDCLAENSR